MDRYNILKKINEIIYEAMELKLEFNDNLLENGIDSLSLVGLIIEIEKKFLITFNDSDLDPNKLNTLGDIINIMEKYL